MPDHGSRMRFGPQPRDPRLTSGVTSIEKLFVTCVRDDNLKRASSNLFARPTRRPKGERRPKRRATLQVGGQCLPIFPQPLDFSLRCCSLVFYREISISSSQLIQPPAQAIGFAAHQRMPWQAVGIRSLGAFSGLSPVRLPGLAQRKERHVGIWDIYVYPCYVHWKIPTCQSVFNII